MKMLLVATTLLASPPADTPPKASCSTQFESPKGFSVHSLTLPQYLLAEGIWLLNPLTPRGFPPGDSAVLMIPDGADDGAVVFLDGEKACQPFMSAPKEMIEDIMRAGLPKGDGL